MRDTIELAREAGYMKTVFGGAEISMASIDCLKDFEALVRADERADCERVVGIALLGAEMDLAKRVLRAIRARGNI
jgi:hypothetical protein